MRELFEAAANKESWSKKQKRENKIHVLKKVVETLSIEAEQLTTKGWKEIARSVTDKANRLKNQIKKLETDPVYTKGVG